MPAVALRGSYTKLLGVSDMDLNTYGLDLSASKGIAFPDTICRCRYGVDHEQST